MAMYKDLTPEQKENNKRAVRKWQQKARAAGYYKRTKEEFPWRYMYKGVRQGARDRGIEFNLTVDYIESIWNTQCPILGIPLFPNVGGKKATDNSPSLDRIDSSKGYIEGNVVVISNRANVIKNMGTAEEHLKIANYLMLLEAAKKDSSPA